MKLAPLPTLLLLAFAAGCAGVSDDEDECTAPRKLATNKLATNKLATNKLATNKLATNELLTAALPEVPLTTGSIAESVPADALQDDFVQDVLEYMVECALLPEQSVEVEVGGERLVFEGWLGLAPQWGDAAGTCDAECQGWVSACLIARTNFEGESRPISLLGDHSMLEPTAEESDTFDIEEATYFGHLFGEDRALYGCVPAGADIPERTCDGEAEGCGIVFVGECDEACDAAGCRDPHGVVYGETIIVNLPDEAASCG
jgi:hypothetical protein